MSPPAANSAASASSASLCFHAKLAFVPYPWASSRENLAYTLTRSSACCGAVWKTKMWLIGFERIWLILQQHAGRCQSLRSLLRNSGKSRPTSQPDFEQSMPSFFRFCQQMKSPGWDFSTLSNIYQSLWNRGTAHDVMMLLYRPKVSQSHGHGVEPNGPSVLCFFWRGLLTHTCCRRRRYSIDLIRSDFDVLYVGHSFLHMDSKVLPDPGSSTFNIGHGALFLVGMGAVAAWVSQTWWPGASPRIRRRRRRRRLNILNHEIPGIWLSIDDENRWNMPVFHWLLRVRRVMAKKSGSCPNCISEKMWKVLRMRTEIWLASWNSSPGFLARHEFFATTLAACTAMISWRTSSFCLRTAGIRRLR